MKILLVPWWLLLFGVTLNSGHYIRDTEYGNPSVYKVQEGSSGVTFVNPKPEKPTLREILYYHIIERPREEPAETERSFTNSHGFQFSDFLQPEALSDEYDEKEELGADEHDDVEHTEDENHEAITLNDEDSENNEEEAPETTTEARPLTDKEVKEAYKSRSYLFDQMRQRYAVKRMAVPDFLNRKKRQAETEIPEAPQLSGKDAYVQPKTYGMNLNPEGGYVWNNLNKPGSYYELGPSNGNPNQGQYESGQSQESTPSSENTYIPPSGTSDSGSSEDIYVSANKPSAMPLGTEPISNPEPVNENSESINENPEATYPVEPITAPNNEESSGGFPNSPIGPEVYDNPEPSDPIEPIDENPSYPSEQEPAVPLPETPISEGPAESAGDTIDPGYGFGQSPEEPKPETQSEESSGEKIKEIPEAPTLPPLNYDKLPDYIRDAILSTEKPGQYESVQSQESTPSSENTYIPPSGTSDSGSSDDTYVNTNRPSATPLDTEPIANPEPVNENPAPINEKPEATYPAEPISAPNDEESSEGFANSPIGPEVYENPEPSDPIEPIVENPSYHSGQEPAVPLPETPISEGPAESAGDTIDPGYGYGQSPEEPKPESQPEESSEGDKIKEIPEAPTLPPLNYDHLPDYIRDAISSTEKPTSYEQTENPYINPQTNADDKKVMEDKMEDIFATITPVEDIPKTYGMNLSSDGGHVWNDMVNPPVSYDIGTPNKPGEEHKEEETQAPIIEQPEIHEEPENPVPAKPEIVEPVANPEAPNQEPETQDSEEPNNPVEEPSEPVQQESEEPIAANPEIPEPSSKPEPELPVNEDNTPIEEPTEPTEPNQEPETQESEEPNNPVEEPSEPVKEESEEPTAANPEIPEPSSEPEPELPVNEDNTPIEEPAEPTEPAVESEYPEPENEDNHDIEKTEQPGDAEEPSEENEEHEPTEQNPEKVNEKPDIMSELLKSEQFWKWLGEWTATYMELLEKHIRKIAIQEICNRQKVGEQMCLLGDNNKDTGVVIKDGKIIVDGKEIDMTHTDNIDSDLKKGHHYNKPDNKGNEVNKIEAATIYGNSVGNDKVTNVFIFTADKADEVIDQMKPANETEVDFVIDDRIKEEDKESNKEKSTEETGAEEPNKGNKEDFNGSETDTEELNKGDVDKSELEETVKEEKAKEPTEAVNKEDFNVSEAETEKPNKEEEKQSSQGPNKAPNNEEISESPSEIDVNSQNKEPSGVIDESDDAGEESKIESSEKNINSKEYLDK